MNYSQDIIIGREREQELIQEYYDLFRPSKHNVSMIDTKCSDNRNKEFRLSERIPSYGIWSFIE